MSAKFVRQLGLLALAFTTFVAVEASRFGAVKAQSDPLAANKKLVQDFVAALNAHDLSLLDSITSDKYVEHNPFTPPDAPPGIDTFKMSASGILAAFPDVVVTIDVILAEGDLVASRHSVKATNKGAFNGIPATNKEVTWTENHLWRIEDGKIVEHWAELNAIGLLTQLGAMPAAK